MPVINKTEKRFSPSQTLVIGFFLIIVVGSLLLCLPISSKSGSFTPFFDCLFTATSATCVTGLVIYDTFAHWNIFGQIVIALLIQVGGIGFVTIITFFNIAAGKKLGFHTLANAADGLTESTFQGGYMIFFRIIKYTIIFELCGALLLSLVFVPRYGAYGIWVSLFMSITAFCNAGFDLMGQDEAFSSLVHLNDEPLVLITIALLIMIGGLGFIVWENFLELRNSRKLSFHTKTVLVMTSVLVIGGTVFYLISEWSNPATLGGMGLGDKILNSFFSSVTARTAGYNSIPIDGMTDFSQLGTIFLMFIGAAPASTGGGIKVTTLLVLVMAVVSYIKNKSDVEIFRHKIGKAVVYRTLVITMLSMLAAGTCFVVLYCFSPSDAVACLFEAVSAFSTTGLSAGVTAETGYIGRAILIITMFIGRVGPISLIMSLVTRSANQKNVIVPDGQIFIG